MRWGRSCGELARSPVYGRDSPFGCCLLLEPRISSGRRHPAIACYCPSSSNQNSCFVSQDVRARLFWRQGEETVNASAPDSIALRPLRFHLRVPRFDCLLPCPLLHSAFGHGRVCGIAIGQSQAHVPLRLVFVQSPGLPRRFPTDSEVSLQFKDGTIAVHFAAI